MSEQPAKPQQAGAEIFTPDNVTPGWWWVVADGKCRAVKVFATPKKGMHVSLGYRHTEKVARAGVVWLCPVLPPETAAHAAYLVTRAMEDIRQDGREDVILSKLGGAAKLLRQAVAFDDGGAE